MKTILIMEDDGDTLDILGVIAQKTDINVVLKSNVVPVSEIQHLDPDLILLDHWLGNQRGGDLCREIKENPATKDIPVVMISALSDIGQIAMDNCADGSIMKPFDINEIEDVIQSYLFFV